jgi:hypothetical protein
MTLLHPFINEKFLDQHVPNGGRFATTQFRLFGRHYINRICTPTFIQINYQMWLEIEFTGDRDVQFHMCCTMHGSYERSLQINSVRHDQYCGTYEIDITLLKLLRGVERNRRIYSSRAVIADFVAVCGWLDDGRHTATVVLISGAQIFETTASVYRSTFEFIAPRLCSRQASFVQGPSHPRRTRSPAAAAVPGIIGWTNSWTSSDVIETQ